MSRNSVSELLGCFLALLAVAMPVPALAAEETTISAFSAWRGGVQMFETGTEEVTFIGALSGTVYVETENGPLASGKLSCPMIVTIDVKDRSQTGSGSCAMTAPEGDRLFGDIACFGFFLIGCSGDFTITGGTGRFEGITGGGPVVIRSELAQLKTASAGLSLDDVAGIIYWRDLHYKIP